MQFLAVTGIVVLTKLTEILLWLLDFVPQENDDLLEVHGIYFKQ